MEVDEIGQVVNWSGTIISNKLVEVLAMEARAQCKDLVIRTEFPFDLHLSRSVFFGASPHP